MTRPDPDQGETLPGGSPDPSPDDARPEQGGDADGQTLFAHEGSRSPAPPTWHRASVLSYCRTDLGLSPREIGTDAEDPVGAVAGPGDRDRYLAGAELARGGMGAILKIFDRDIRRPVAMKVALAGDDPERIERFIEEAQVTGQLEHPNIVPVHELGVNDAGKLYFTMKLVRGESLQAILERLAKTGPGAAVEEGYSLSRLLQIFMKVCDAVAFAHAKGIVHRDLKPENIMVGHFGEVLVMDWGLAKVRGREDTSANDLVATVRSEKQTGRTLDGDVMGTPSYMPPEQAEGRVNDIDERSDVWALGAILYALLTHEAPYSGPTVASVLTQAAKGVLPTPRKRKPNFGIPAELDAICATCMAFAQADRYPSVAALSADIQAFLERRLVSAYRYGLLERLARWVQRHPTASMGSGVAAVLISVGLALSLLLIQQARIAELRAVRAEEQRETAKAKAVQAEAQADAALSLLEKGRLVAAVNRAATVELDSVFRRLSAAFHSRKTDAALRETAARAWPEVEAFEKQVKSDSASQAAWLAMKGWLSRLAGKPEQARDLFARSANTDPDLAHGALYPAMAAAAQFLNRQPMPVLIYVGGRFVPQDVAPESEAAAAARERFTALLEKVRRARVWGESSAADFGAVQAGLDGLRGIEVEKAEASLTRALSMPEMAWLEPDLRLARAKIRRVLGRFDGMEADLDRLLDLCPDHPQGRYFLGLLKLTQGKELANRGRSGLTRYEEAIALLQAEAAEEPDHAAVVANLAEALYQRGRVLAHRGKPFEEDFRSALNRYDTILGRGDRDRITHNLRGFVYIEFGRRLQFRGHDPTPWYQKAEADFTAALSFDPDFHQALTNRAEARLLHGAYLAARGREPVALFDGAVADCRRSLELDPDYIRTYRIRARLFVRKAQWLGARNQDVQALFRQALEDYDRFLEAAPHELSARVDRATAKAALADLMGVRGENPIPRLEEAVAELEDVLAQAPEMERVHQNLGNAYTRIADERHRRGQPMGDAIEKALSRFDGALALNPNDATLYVSRGQAQLLFAQREHDAGRDAKAPFDRVKQDAEAALARNPDQPRAHALLALLYKTLGDIEPDRMRRAFEINATCLKYCDAALARDPGDWRTLILKGRVLGAVRRYRESVAAFEQAAQIVGDGYGELKSLLADAREKERRFGWQADFLDGNKAIHAKDWARARELFEKALSGAKAAGAYADRRLRQPLMQGHFSLALFCVYAAQGRVKGDEAGAPPPPEKGKAYLEQAVVNLRKAAELGWPDTAKWKTAPELQMLRDLDSFKALLADIDAGTFK